MNPAVPASPRGFPETRSPLGPTPRGATGFGLICLLSACVPCVCSLFGTCATLHAAETRGESAADSIADRLSWEMTSWKSIELRSEHTYEFSGSRRDDTSRAKVIKSTTIKTADKRHVYESTAYTEDGRVRHFLDADDGGVHSEVAFDETDGTRPKTITLRASQTKINKLQYYDILIPRGFRELYINDIPVYLKLKEAEYLGPVAVDGWACESFRFRNVRLMGTPPKDLVYCFDKSSGMPVQVGALYSKGGKPVVLSEWRALSLERRQGHHFPTSSRTSYFRFDPSGESKSLDIKIESKVNFLRFNGDFPLETFRPARPPGVTIVDKLRHKVYTVPGKDPLGPAKKGSPTTRSTVPHTWADLRIPSSSEWLLLVGACMVLGGAVSKVAGWLGPRSGCTNPAGESGGS